MRREHFLGGLVSSVSGLIPGGGGGGGSSSSSTSTSATTNYNGLSGAEITAILAASGTALAQQGKSHEAITNAIIDGNVSLTGKIIDAGTEAARINGEVAINQANRTADIMKNADDNDRIVELSRIQNETARRQTDSAERIGMAGIASNERKELAQMSADLQAFTVGKMADQAAYMASLQLEGAMASQENLLALADAAGDRQAASNSEALARMSNISAKSIDEISDLARSQNKDLKEVSLIMSDALSLQNRINAEERDKMANAAMENQIKLTGVLLGPRGVEGLLGQQGTLMNNQQEQLNRANFEMQKLFDATIREKLIRDKEAQDENEALRKQLQLMELEKIKKESTIALSAIEKLSALQKKNPDMIKRPVSENIMGMISETILSSTQNCKGTTSGTMRVSIGGTRNTITNNTIRQSNKFSSTCMQDISISYAVQTKIASTIIEAVTISSRAVADSMGLDPTQLDRKVHEEVASKFNSSALQEILNQANNAMDIEIGGTDNVIQAQLIEQINESVFNSTQKIAATISFIQEIEKNSQSTLDSDTTIVSDESKNASELGKTQAIAGAIADVSIASSNVEMLQMLMYFGIFVVIMLVVGGVVYAIQKKKNRKNDNKVGGRIDNSAFGEIRPHYDNY